MLHESSPPGVCSCGQAVNGWQCDIFFLVQHTVWGGNTSVQLISEPECLYLMKVDCCEWAAPPSCLASNSLTCAMPINLMTLWLFWIFISPCWTLSICYSMRWLWGGESSTVWQSAHKLPQLFVTSNGHPSSSASPPPPFLPALLYLHCFTLLLGLQVIGNGTDPSWSPRLPSWSVNVVWNHTSGDEL